ncbi:MAG: homoserine dehydrogenase [Actinobacteria bacterium]|nr:homoserine dehydrogenase [Actinomycetota bacterium]MBE3114178.1 homoserine dehydrogenase [Actinomycetota bacterium]
MKIENKNIEDINIGIIGFGYIASCVFSLIQRQKDYLAKKIKKNLNITRIAEKDLKKIEASSMKGLKDIKVSSNADDVLEDGSIDIIVELIGGINPAYDYVYKALSSGKYVVTANKDLIANRGGELLAVAERNNVDILFEASVGGGIPIIGPLNSSLASNNISKIVGIVNGTTNYILTRMEKDNLSFDDALKKAQELGYAEKANPSSDIEGYDAACKLAILSSIAFNSRVTLNDVYKEGIIDVSSDDIRNALDMGYRIKLLAIGIEENGEISVRVHPALIPISHILASIENTFNAVYVYGNYIDEMMSYGRGAGDRPTASSVVGDIIKIARNFDRKKKGIIYGCSCFEDKKFKSIDDTISKFYILIDVVDKPGVLARIAEVFGRNLVSINSMIQKQTDKEKSARLIFITHEVINKNLYKSISEISKLDVVDKVLSIIRVEDLS